jgi:flavin reductase (DIM6/NTAB) family NADH-FMN oxidoreductase RutF
VIGGERINPFKDPFHIKFVAKLSRVDLHKAYRLFYPTVPAILTSTYNERISAMPVVSYSMISNKPAIVGVALSRTHSTYRTIIRSKTFALSWVNKKYVKVVEFLGNTSGRKLKNKLQAAGLSQLRSPTLKIPIPRAAQAFIECTYSKSFEVGDHNLMLGRVLAAFASDDFNEYWKFKTYEPLLYAGERNGLSVYPTKHFISNEERHSAP